MFLASITHLMFDPRLPLARQIAAYQKHRIKGIRREAAGAPDRTVSGLRSQRALRFE
jgi:hypothetical protein